MYLPKDKKEAEAIILQQVALLEDWARERGIKTPFTDDVEAMNFFHGTMGEMDTSPTLLLRSPVFFSKELLEIGAKEGETSTMRYICTDALRYR